MESKGEGRGLTPLMKKRKAKQKKRPFRKENARLFVFRNPRKKYGLYTLGFKEYTLDVEEV